MRHMLSAFAVPENLRPGEGTELAAYSLKGDQLVALSGEGGVPSKMAMLQQR
jgi:hypothetical protein